MPRAAILNYWRKNTDNQSSTYPSTIQAGRVPAHAQKPIVSRQSHAAIYDVIVIKFSSAGQRPDIKVYQLSRNTH